MSNKKAKELFGEENKDSKVQKAPRKRRKIVIILFSIIGVILTALLMGLLVILIKSPGKLDPLKDAQGNVILGSIS